MLLSNDDGVTAPGLTALRQALAPLGDVWVVAPELEQSGVSHAITLHRALRVRQVEPQRFAVDGTPTDCVYLALHKLLPRAPDMVVSGINHGGNLGDDVLYSGTVSAAMEGAHHGNPAIAVSLVGRPTDEGFAVAGAFSHALARFCLDNRLARGLLLNVNVPKRATMQTPFRFCALGKHSWKPTVEERKDPRGKPYYWIGGPWDGHDDVPGTDVHAIERDIISVTPVRASLTDTTALSGMLNIGELHAFRRADPEP
ncbi:MAG: 5'/3'-nucleotidase SurE [Deltaproteobacteria bacterium]|nr:5'/3'-nucleotidase SurE [Deltaproteobacteria bacterium]